MPKKITVEGSPIFMKFFQGLDKKTKQYKEIDYNLDLLKLDPARGDKISNDLWPKVYVKKYGIHVLFRIELNDGWRLIYTISGKGNWIICTVLEVLNHKEYEKRFNY